MIERNLMGFLIMNTNYVLKLVYFIFIFMFLLRMWCVNFEF